jgi:hypothetical protein
MLLFILLLILSLYTFDNLNAFLIIAIIAGIYYNIK